MIEIFEFEEAGQGNIQGRRVNLILESSYYMEFRSSLQSHPLWVTLYAESVLSRQKVTNYELDIKHANFAISEN